MAYTFDEIVGIIRQRENAQTPVLKKMVEVKERYNGDYVIPLPTLDEEPILPPLTPALISENIDPIKTLPTKTPSKFKTFLAKFIAVKHNSPVL